MILRLLMCMWVSLALIACQTDDSDSNSSKSRTLESETLEEPLINDDQGERRNRHQVVVVFSQKVLSFDTALVVEQGLVEALGLELQPGSEYPKTYDTEEVTLVFEETSDFTATYDRVSSDPSTVAVICHTSVACEHAKSYPEQLFVSTMATATELSDSSIYPNLLLMAPQNVFQSSALYKKLQSDNIGNFAVVYENTLYSKDLYQFFNLQLILATLLPSPILDSEGEAILDENGDLVFQPVPKQIYSVLLGEGGETTEQAHNQLETLSSEMDAVVYLGASTLLLELLDRANTTRSLNWYGADANFELSVAQKIAENPLNFEVISLGRGTNRPFNAPENSSYDYGYDTGLYLKNYLDRDANLSNARDITFEGLTGTKVFDELPLTAFFDIFVAEGETWSFTSSHVEVKAEEIFNFTDATVDADAEVEEVASKIQAGTKSVVLYVPTGTDDAETQTVAKQLEQGFLLAWEEAQLPSYQETDLPTRVLEKIANEEAPDEISDADADSFLEDLAPNVISSEEPEEAEESEEIEEVERDAGNIEPLRLIISSTEADTTVLRNKFYGKTSNEEEDGFLSYRDDPNVIAAVTYNTRDTDTVTADLQKRDLLVLSAFGTSTGLTLKENVVMIAPSNLLQSQLMAEKIKSLSKKSIVVFEYGLHDSYAFDLFQQFLDPDLNAPPFFTQSYGITRSDDGSYTYPAGLSEQTPEALFYLGSSPGLLDIHTHMGSAQSVHWVSGDLTYSQNALALDPVPDNISVYALADAGESEETTAYQTAYQAKYGEETTSYSVYAYDRAKCLIQWIQFSKLDQREPPEGITRLSLLEASKSEPCKGITGTKGRSVPEKERGTFQEWTLDTTQGSTQWKKAE